MNNTNTTSKTVAQFNDLLIILWPIGYLIAVIILMYIMLAICLGITLAIEHIYKKCVKPRIANATF